MFTAVIPTNTIDVLGVIFVTNHLDRNKVEYEMDNGRIYLANRKIRVTCYAPGHIRYRKNLYHVREYGMDSYKSLDELIYLLGACH
jgi:hypothetical protein